VLPDTLNIKSVANRICFDSRFVTRLLALVKKLGLTNLLQINWLRNSIMSLLERISLGSDLFAVKVDSFGSKEGKTVEFECSVVGKNEAWITGQVAAVATEYIFKEEYPAGVYHIEELFALADVLDQLEEEIDFYTN
jgi:hypothetical protein